MTFEIALTRVYMLARSWDVSRVCDTLCFHIRVMSHYGINESLGWGLCLPMHHYFLCQLQIHVVKYGIMWATR
jgi:hypothetical protein